MSPHTRGPDCETCEGHCLYSDSEFDALAALRELIAVKQEAEEISRRKQRRSASRFNADGRQELREVNAMHEAWKARNYRAWNVARAVIARSTT